MTKQCKKDVANQKGLRRRPKEQHQQDSDQEIRMKECETKKNSIGEMQPHEWFLALIDEPVSEYYREEEWDSAFVRSFSPVGTTAEVSNLFYGPTEWNLGLGSEEVDLRGGEQLAREGATPYEVFYWVRWRHEFQRKEIPSNDYLDGIVYRVFLDLFIEGVRERKFPCLEQLCNEVGWLGSTEILHYSHDKATRSLRAVCTKPHNQEGGTEKDSS
jgi:hypothetical protein